MESSRKSLRMALLILLAGLMMGPADIGAAPDWAISGRVEQFDRLVLAEAPLLGSVSALDLMMFDSLRDPQLGELPQEAWLEPDALEAEIWRPLLVESVTELAALAAVAERSADWQPPADLLRRLSFDGATAVWAELVVAPELVKVAEADIHRYYIANPQIFLQRRLIELRTIFFRNQVDTAQSESRRQELEQIARRVREGQLGFAEAARQHSDAPSAAQGGLLPAFYNGTFFSELERQALLLEPGELSPVFEGPGGIYLVQLVSASAPHNIPLESVREEIREQLRRDHVAGYYRYALERLQRQHAINNWSNLFGYLHHEAPIARIGRVALGRGQYLRFYGNPVMPNYQLDRARVASDVNHWIEGESVMLEVERLGLTDHPWVARARQLGALAPRARQTFLREIDPASYETTEGALRTMSGPAAREAGLRAARVLTFEMTPEFDAPPIPAEALAAERQIEELSSQIGRGVLRVEPEPIILAERVRAAAAPGGPGLDVEARALAAALEGTPRVGVRLRVRGPQWVDVVPGTPYYRLLRGVSVGEVGRAERVGTTVRRHLILDERELDLEPWIERPFILQEMAWLAASEQILAAERDRLRATGAIELNF